MKTNICSSTS